ncbi:hypothetical protein EVA_07302, partial [gut metagenome]
MDHNHPARTGWMDIDLKSSGSIGIVVV